jgi:hypothetical protein
LSSDICQIVFVKQINKKFLLTFQDETTRMHWTIQTLTGGKDGEHSTIKETRQTLDKKLSTNKLDNWTNTGQPAKVHRTTGQPQKSNSPEVQKS